MNIPLELLIIVIGAAVVLFIIATWLSGVLEPSIGGAVVVG